MGVVTSFSPSNYPSVTLRRNSDWIFSQDIPSDVTVLVSGVAYSLHKFPLVSRCGWIRRWVADSKDSDLSKIELLDFPGGAEAFELAAKFCYGINFQIDAKNVAALRCAAAYLNMSEECVKDNLIARTEAYLNEPVVDSLSNCVAVLQACESLLPMAEELDIVSRCVDGAAAKACRDQMTPSLSRSDISSSGRMDVSASPSFIHPPKRRSVEWWAEELSVLRIDIYQRIISAMKARGIRSDSLGAAIVHYAHRWVRGLSRKHPGLDQDNRTKAKVQDSGKVHDSTTAFEHEQRVLVETLVSLLPGERNITSVGFLFALLRTAIHLDTTVACKLDLEQRIGWQLEQATVDDLLIPSDTYKGATLFDLDTVQRIVVSFLQQEGRDEEQDALAIYDYESTASPAQSSMMKAARLLDCFLAEIAPDANLSVAKFVGLAELMPEYARVVDDGLYRAIDIYLKAHPGLSELERKKLCSLMDCRKLSQEACTHAAQNERLPVQIVVQVLYAEQMRLKNVMTGGSTCSGEAEEMADQAHFSHRMVTRSPRDDYAAVQRENRELKMEVARMKSRLGEKEQKQLPPKPQEVVHGYIKHEGEKPKSRFFQSVSKTLGKLNPFHRNSSNDNNLKSSRTPDVRTSRRPRRHSIS